MERRERQIERDWRGERDTERNWREGERDAESIVFYPIPCQADLITATHAVVTIIYLVNCYYPVSPQTPGETKGAEWYPDST